MNGAQEYYWKGGAKRAMLGDCGSSYDYDGKTEPNLVAHSNTAETVRLRLAREVDMTSPELFARFIDSYERQARLYPALLVAAPLFAIAVGIYGVQLELRDGLIALLVSFGFVYLATTLSRELGKRLEEKLFDLWGGKPTTQLLRHRDNRLDIVTKTRYHAFLARKLNVQFPDRNQALADPELADSYYVSGARWLLEQTRDTNRFPLIFKELIAYGFRRNCLGLKPLAIFVALLSLVWIATASGVVTLNGIDWDAMSRISVNFAAVALLNSFLLALWIFFISKRTVRSSAFMYAELLLRACDVL
jgi:hypothetical protein